MALQAGGGGGKYKAKPAPKRTKGTNQKLLLPKAKPKKKYPSVMSAGIVRGKVAKKALPRPSSKTRPLNSKLQPKKTYVQKKPVRGQVIKPVTRKTPMIKAAPKPVARKVPVKSKAQYATEQKMRKQAATAKAQGRTYSTRTGMGKVGSAGPPKKSAAQYATEQKMKKQAEAQAKANALSQYMKNASAAVQAELQPALNDLNRQIAELGARGAKQGKETQEKGARADEDLKQIFGKLTNFTGQVKNASNQNHAQAQQRVGTQYDQLMQQLTNTYGQAAQGADAENARLGLGNIAGASGDAMNRDKMFLQGLAGTDRAAVQGNMANSQNSFDQLMSMAQGNSEAGGAMYRGQNQRDTAKSLNDLMFELNQGTTNLRGKIGDIEGTRGEKIRQMAEALQERDYNRQMEQEQMRFERDLATKRFQLDQRQVNAALTPQPASYMDQLKAAELEQKIAAEAARQRQAQMDAEWQAAFKKLWPNAPGT